MNKHTRKEKENWNETAYTSEEETNPWEWNSTFKVKNTHLHMTQQPNLYSPYTTSISNIDQCDCLNSKVQASGSHEIKMNSLFLSCSWNAITQFGIQEIANFASSSGISNHGLELNVWLSYYHFLFFSENHTILYKPLSHIQEKYVFFLRIAATLFPKWEWYISSKPPSRSHPILEYFHQTWPTGDEIYLP